MGLRIIIIYTLLLMSVLIEAELPPFSGSSNQPNSIEDVVKYFSPGNKGPRCPPQNGAMAVLLPHETKCGQYYVCDTGLAIQMECPHELHFNRANKVCDVPANALCDAGKSEVEKPGVEIVTPLSPEVPNSSPGRRDPRCPLRNGKYPHFMPHECECGRYYVCDTGLAILMRCPVHLHFNTRLNVCDEPYDAECHIEEFRKKASAPAAAPPLPSVIMGQYGVMLSPGKKDSRCPDRLGATIVFLTHENLCGRYYVCDNHGLAILMQCPDHLHFNKAKNVCDEPEQAGCKTGA